MIWDRLKYIEQELAKKRGQELGMTSEEIKPAEDDLYIIPEHLKVWLIATLLHFLIIHLQLLHQYRLSREVTCELISGLLFPLLWCIPSIGFCSAHDPLYYASCRSGEEMLRKARHSGQLALPKSSYLLSKSIVEIFIHWIHCSYTEVDVAVW